MSLNLNDCIYTSTDLFKGTQMSLFNSDSKLSITNKKEDIIIDYLFQIHKFNYNLDHVFSWKEGCKDWEKHNNKFLESTFDTCWYPGIPFPVFYIKKHEIGDGSINYSFNICNYMIPFQNSSTDNSEFILESISKFIYSNLNSNLSKDDSEMVEDNIIIENNFRTIHELFLYLSSFLKGIKAHQICQKKSCLEKDDFKYINN